MNIFFFGYAVPNNNQEENQAISPIGNNMQLGILREWGKILKENLRIYTFHPISSYNKSKTLIFKSRKIELEDGIETRILPFINITIIKQICIMIASIFYIMKDVNRYKGESNVVLTYHVSIFYSIPVLVLSKVLNFKSVCLISDAPIDFNKRKNKIVNFFRVVSNFLRTKLIRKYDAYLTINENVIKEFEIKRPYLPIYVGADIIKENNIISKRTIKSPIKITYTGAIEEYYNIDKMIDVMKILGTDYELNLYGKGSLVEKINFDEIPNINYHGVVSNEMAREIQCDSNVLISLLSKDSYLGKYAFPGKIFEYLLSGTPVVSCKTPSISSELRPFLNFVEEETVDSISESIRKITQSEHDYCRVLQTAEDGRIFVVNNCNWNNQVLRIHDFINELFNKK